MTAESVSALADQIAKGVHPNRCTHRIFRSVFIFFYAADVTVDAMAVSYSIGNISAEYLELIDQEKPREKRRLIRKKIRELREYVKANMEDSRDDN